jgi:multidrug efflux system membrane fusion protein
MNRLLCVLAAGCLACAATPIATAADVPAVVGWAQRVELGMLVSGVVAEVHVRPGQSVKKGDELLSLDQRGFKSQAGRRLAEYRHAKAMLEEAKREDERAVELYDRTVLSDFERNQALIALKSAQAASERAAAELVAARLDLERSVLLAPFDGVVLAVNAAPGQSIVSELQSQPLVTVADDRSYYGRAQVDAAQAGALPPGKSLDATLRGQGLKATVAYVGFEPVSESDLGPRYELVVDLPSDPQQPLRVGETVILHLD